MAIPYNGVLGNIGKAFGITSSTTSVGNTGIPQMTATLANQQNAMQSPNPYTTLQQWANPNLQYTQDAEKEMLRQEVEMLRKQMLKTKETAKERDNSKDQKDEKYERAIREAALKMKI